MRSIHSSARRYDVKSTTGKPAVVKSATPAGVEPPRFCGMNSAERAGMKPTGCSAMKSAGLSGVEAAAETAAMEAATETTTAASAAMRGVGEIRRRQRRDAQQCGREKSRRPADAGPGARRLRGNHNLADIDPFHEDLLLCVGRPTGRPRRQAEVGRWR